MGINYSGSMLVGLSYDSINEPDNLEELGIGLDEYLTEICGMDTWSEHYDADSSYRCYGYPIPDTPLGTENNILFPHEFLKEVNEAYNKFLEATGQKPYLIGMQDIC